ncbi:S8 family peptidase [soil metagenome]
MVTLKWHTSVLLLGLICAVALLIFASSASGQVAGAEIDEDATGAPYAAGELLVTYKENASARDMQSVEQVAGADVEKAIPEIDTQLVELPDVKGERVESVRERELEKRKKELERDPAVKSVDYNYVYTGSFTPRDPKFKKQWGLRRTGFEKAWNRTRGKGIRIAIIDSGAAIRHNDLRYKIAAKYDFRDRNRSVEDLNGHGTHVAGKAAAKINRKGVVGGCPSCHLIVAKALGKNLIGYNSDIIDAIVWSTRKKARVINLSLGSTSRSQAMKEAVDFARRRGAVVVAAGGNYGNNKSVYPAAHSGVIGVSYTTRKNRRASGASYGPWIDVAAPGYDILSTVPRGYARKTGSSMASPHVAGLAGLMARKGYKRRAIERRIQRTAKDLGPAGRDRFYGAGLIRADRAVR